MPREKVLYVFDHDGRCGVHGVEGKKLLLIPGECLKEKVGKYVCWMCIKDGFYNNEITATMKKLHFHFFSYEIGESVNYYGLMDPLSDLKGQAKITNISYLPSMEPVVWLEGVSGAWSANAISKV